MKRFEVNPGYVKATTEKPETTSVVMYKVKTLETHLKIPKVIKLKGRRNILRRGFMRRSAPVSATAPIAKIWKLPPNSIPPTFFATNHNTKICIAKDFINPLIINSV